MNKKDISEIISRNLSIRKFEAYNFIGLLIEVINENLNNGEKIVISNFGKFIVVKRNEKKVINPNNKEIIIIAPKKVVKFFPSKNLKKKITGK
jgi:nucleoid DNA-binding protein